MLPEGRGKQGRLHGVAGPFAGSGRMRWRGGHLGPWGQQEPRQRGRSGGERSQNDFGVLLGQWQGAHQER